MTREWELTEIENLLHELAREHREDDDLGPPRPPEVDRQRRRRHLRLV